MRLLIAALAFVLSPSPALAQQWWEAETAHFIIKSRDSERNTREFALTMERFDRGMRFLQGLPEDHEEISSANKPLIYRFGDFVDMSRWYGDSEAGVGGFFMSRAGGSIAFAPARRTRTNNSRDRRDRTSSVEQVLLHEYVHYFMFQNVPAAYPRWYSEGYAEMMSTMQFHADGSFHIGNPPQSRGQAINLLPSSRLSEMLDAERQLTGLSAFQHYVTGWLFSHYMSFDPQREAMLREFLVALGNGEDSLTAAQRIFGDLDELQRDLVRYKNGPFPGYNIRPNVMTEPTVVMRRITGVERELIEQEMRLWRGVSREEAARVANTLREEAANFPNSSYVYRLLAEAEYDSRDYTAAAAAAERATELDPANQEAWLYRGKIAMAMAEDEPAYYEVARDFLAEARQLDPEDPRPLIEFYRSYYEATDGADIPDFAIIALEQAYDEAGSDGEYRLLLGRQLAMENRFAEAGVVMRPTLFQGHSFREPDEEDEFTPARLFAALEAEDREQTLMLLNKVLDPEEDEQDG